MNRISSYIRQLLHLSINDYCLLGRLITLNINDVATIESDNGDVITVLRYHNAIMTYCLFHDKSITLLDPFKECYDKISIEKKMSHISHYVHIQCENYETIVIDNTYADGVHNQVILEKKSKTWYSGARTYAYRNRLYNIFNCDGILINITSMSDNELMISHNYDCMLYNLSSNELQYDEHITSDIRNHITQCINYLKNE